jgi:hypothetical protein
MMRMGKRLSVGVAGVRLARLATLLVIASCGGGSMQMDPRFVAVHNAMAATGLVQSGEISQGSLSEGGESIVRMTLQPGDCYTIVGLGTDGVSDLDVIVRDPSGNELARDGSQDRQAATHFCPPFAGEFQVVLRMTRGSGEWMASAWSGAPRPRGDYPDVGYPRPDQVAAARPPHGGPGTCEQPFELTPGASVRGDTTTGDAVTTGSCIGGGSAPEHVYQFTLDERSMVTAVMDSVFDGSLYLLGSCGEARSELVCNDDAPTTSRSEIGATLEPGLYFLVADGYGTAFGE